MINGIPKLRCLRTSLVPSLALLVLLPLASQAQTLNITDGVQSYGALTNTTVNMSGRSELHITGTNSPIPGCVINLNSSDAWFFMDNIQPATVVSDYLGQIAVSGSPAVSGSNVRVAEFAMGAVVIPHSPAFQPLEVFAGTEFTGTSLQPNLYTYYNTTNLGSLYKGISSFRLKRGYMATFAQNPDGSGLSRTYVAQNGDVEVGALPSMLNDSIGFVRVVPWRWTAKKGWAGSPQLLVNPLWSYDWDNAASSSLNVEYVPMRHNANWNAYANINNKQDSTAALGFNEPDSSSQANMTVDQAIAAWPNLMASGLRLGSPAPTDGGLSWLYSFIDKADALNYRVDYVAVHFYRCGYTATQLYNWLYDIHKRTRRPIWITEFNNGATWTTCATPTLSQNATTIGDFINMMENAPFVERYAIYNWVGDTRAMVDTNGTLTPAGIVYRDKASNVAYKQELPAGVGADANYLLDGDVHDRTGGGNHGLIAGAPTFTTGQTGQAIALNGVRDYVQLPANLGDSASFTFGAWVKWNGGAAWQRVFDLGDGESRYLFLTPSSGSGTLRFAITTNTYSAEQVLSAAALTPGTWTHVAVTLSGSNARLYVNGALAASSSTFTLNPAVVATKYNYLGKSQFAADPLFNGQLDNVFFASYALTDAQVAGMMNNLPPQFSADPIVKPATAPYSAYSDSIANTAIDPDGGGLTFSKVEGPAWLNVATSGAISGTPGIGDVGANSFTVRAVDANGAAAITRLEISVTAAPQLIARYSFNGNTMSSVGNVDGALTGTAVYAGGHEGQAIDLDGTANFVTLPAGVASSSNITIAAWVNWDGSSAWQRVFDFGNGTSQYLFLTPNSASGTLRFAIKNGGSEQALETSPLTIGQWTHVAVTINGNVGSLYVNGVLAATSTGITIHPSDFKPASNYIGKSQWPDPLFNGRIDEFLIYNYALTDAQIAALAANTAPSFASNPITQPDATAGQAYSGSVAGTASDPDSGDTLTYSKAGGAAWLQVAADGTLSGTPGSSDLGTNSFLLRVTDSALASADTTMLVNVVTVAPPAAPTGLTGTAGNSVVNLNWVQSTSSGVTTNRVYRSTSGNSGPYDLHASLAATTAYSDTSVVNGSTYFYTVTAMSQNGESAFSSYVGVTPGPPAAPTNLSASAGRKKITLTWTQSSSANIASNAIYRATVNGGPYTLLTTVAATTSYVNSGLNSGATYYYVVTAINGSNLESPYSSQASATSK